jgi:hypothetical protein
MLELTLTSPYLIVDFEVQLFTPTTSNMDEQQIGKGRERCRGREGVGVEELTLQYV